MTKNFSKEIILQVRESLRNDSAGNKQSTMTDLDLACDMLSELMSMKHAELSLYNLCKIYFEHPCRVSKTKKKHMRKQIRPLFQKLDRFLPNKK